MKNQQWRTLLNNIHRPAIITSALLKITRETMNMSSLGYFSRLFQRLPRAADVALTTTGAGREAQD